MIQTIYCVFIFSNINVNSPKSNTHFSHCFRIFFQGEWADSKSELCCKNCYCLWN